MKFNHHSDEESCGKRVPGDLSAKYSHVGGLACMRTAGHVGDCIAMTRDAGIADGVRWCCRVASSAVHTSWCPVMPSVDSPEASSNNPASPDNRGSPDNPGDDERP